MGDLVDEIATAIDKFGVQSQSELEAMVKRRISEKRERKKRTSKEDWRVTQGQKIAEDFIPPCVMPGCWDEAVDVRKFLCPLHELAYIAKHGQPSEEVSTDTEWGRMLDKREEIL